MSIKLDAADPNFERLKALKLDTVQRITGWSLIDAANFVNECRYLFDDAPTKPKPPTNISPNYDLSHTLKHVERINAQASNLYENVTYRVISESGEKYRLAGQSEWYDKRRFIDAYMGEVESQPDE